MSVFIPKIIADAIESCWEYIQSVEPNAVKYIVLNDWTKIAECCSDEAKILKPFAQENPVKYMQALVEGYEVEFDKEMLFNFNGVELSFADTIKEGSYTANFPIKIGVGSAYEILSIDEAKNISDHINVLIQELRKVRNDI